MSTVVLTAMTPLCHGKHKPVRNELRAYPRWYEIIALVGAGGMGGVYRATDTKLGREVAFPQWAC
jgi:serine/threonine protein kinase